MSFNLSRFFNLERFFNLQPSININTVYFLLGVFGVFVVLAIFIKLIKKTTKHDSFYKNLLNKYFVMLMTMGLLGVFYTWIRYERAYFLSARFWLVVWVVGLIVWLVYILKYQIKVMPNTRKQLQKSQEFNKYLPKKK